VPTYRITAPDGRVYNVSGEGSAEDALAHIQSTVQAEPQQSQPEPQADPSSGGGTLSIGPFDTGVKTPQGVDRFLSGAGKAMVDIGRGAGQLVGLVDKQDVQASRERDAPLMATGAGKAGAIAGGIATAVPAALIPGANTVAGAGLIGAGYGLLQPAESLQERGLNTAVGGAAGAAGQAIGQKVSQFAANRIASRAGQASVKAEQNAVRDTTLQVSKKAGYVVPPSQTNPTVTNRVLETVSGKAATEQAAMAKNQVVTNRLVRKSLGLGESTPLTRKTLEAIRKREGGVYKEISAFGEIVPDGQYVDDLADIAKSIDDVAKDFPDANVGANEEVGTLVNSLLRDKFQASSAMEYIKQLRKSASGNLSGLNVADPSKRALGAAQRDGAAALEEVVMRHLKANGKGALADQFDKSRTLIAKTYSVENALNESSGNVVAANLARDLKKGKPLSGELETVAKFAQAFPDSAREAKRSVGVSALDAVLGASGYAAAGPAGAALPLARYGARGAILSKPYQAGMTTPNYQQGATGKALLEAVKKGGKNAAIPASVYAAQE
jgi:hypothetical protein